MKERPDKNTGTFGNPVLQQTRCFNDNSLDLPKCRRVLVDLVWLLQTDPLNAAQATQVFFALTKLFLSSDLPLRLLVYVAVKLLAPVAQDVMMLTASLTRDVQNPGFKGGAIRTLATITPPEMQPGILRFVKQAVTDPRVASQVLVALYHMDLQTVKHMSTEIADLTQSKNAMVQYHAIGLAYRLKQNDRVALLKLCQTCCQIRSPLGLVLIVRFIQLIQVRRDPY